MRQITIQKPFETNIAELLQLQDKYPSTGPRYTSYPTIVECQDMSDSSMLKHHLKTSNNGLIPSDLSLFLHMPFCRHLCFYCGCNKVVTRNEEKSLTLPEIPRKRDNDYWSTC